MVRNTLGQVDSGHLVAQTLVTSGGDTLVRWAASAELDPRGPRSLGVQVYDPQGHFRFWLEDAAGIDRDLVVCGRFVVGGGNTLRVWDTARPGFPVVARRAVPDLPAQASLTCTSQELSAPGWAGRRSLPALRPLR